jgi:outer membrane protein OmpA-like peptidoglycan-associated protein
LQSNQAKQTEQASPAEDVPGREGGPQEFQISDAKGSAKSAHGVKPSVIKGTQTEAALKFFVVDLDKGPIPGIVVVLSAPGADKLYAPETDVEGYAEILVPIGRTYELTYLSLGRRDVAARLTVSDKPKQNLRLTMRYKRIDPPPPEHPSAAPASDAEPRFVLDGVLFDSASAQIRPESYARLDSVVEYMAHKPNARIEIAGHTDNAGNAKANKALSQKRAEACRDYLTRKGIAPGRIEAIGYGDERPIAGNDTPAGREQNRRIEAKELVSD